MIAVDGEDGAGKTRFADHLAAVFAEDGSPVLRATLDDFHRPRSERYRRGRSSPEGFYRDSYDYDAFRRLLIEPFRTGAEGGVRLAAFDLVADLPVDAPTVSVPTDAVLVVDGIFANRPELRGIWQLYLKEARPRTAADAIVDNTDPTAPRRVYADFC